MLGARSGGKTDTLRWTDLANQSEATALNIAAGTTQNNRRVFLSPPLKTGPALLRHAAGSTCTSSLDKPQSNLAAMLVDYGPSTQITRSGDGISTPADAPSDCWGSSLDPRRPRRPGHGLRRLLPDPDQADGHDHRHPGLAHQRGILDSTNRDSLYADVPVTPGAEYEFKFPILPVDYTIPAGHRVGVVLMANFSASSATARPARRSRSTRESLEDLAAGRRRDARAGGGRRAVRRRVDARRRAGRRHRAGDAVADARRAGLVRRVHAGRGEGLHGVHDRQRDLDRGRRGADRERPRPPDERDVRAAVSRCRSTFSQVDAGRRRSPTTR